MAQIGNYRYYLQECGGKCMNIKKPCSEKCFHKVFSHRCGDSCIQKDKVESYWECQGKCLPHKEPCNGTCPKRAPHLCRGKCVSDAMYKSEYQDCNGKCILHNMMCNAQCLKPELPVKCNDHCIGVEDVCTGTREEMAPRDEE